MTSSRRPPSASTSRRSTATGVGVFAAVCAVCYAGPLLVVVGEIGTLGAAAAFLVRPVVGVLLAGLMVAVVVLLRRRRRAAACRMDGAPVPVVVTRRAQPTRSGDGVGGRR